ncbi:MAG: hypothetical protein KJ698_01400 [Actinobacteria bacterium]|nr:hypothetical protein [Actinomycetota bacterium]MBU1494998.1 hypothetical protein [Actinomycetota bacterium]MBU1865145.1 hypothetical protein [Actinomycetota bacterium]
MADVRNAAGDETDMSPESVPNESRRRPTGSSASLTRRRRWGIAATVIGLLVGVLVFMATVVLDGETTEVTLEEYDAAVQSAFAALLESPGVEGVEFGYIDDYLAGAVWFDSRPNGDVSLVQWKDLDVDQYGWSLIPTEGPSATGSNTATTVWVGVDDALYEATLTNGQPHDGWSISDLISVPRGSLAYGLSLLADYEQIGPTDDGEVTYHEAPDGGSTWTLTAPLGDGYLVQRWQIRASGELQSLSYDLVGVNRSMRPGPGITSASIEFMPLEDPNPIKAPNLGADPNIAEFNLPEDFPLGSG